MLTSSLYLPFLVHGILLMLLGVAAIASPNVATMTVGVMLGLALVAAGVVGIATYVSVRGVPGVLWILLWGLLATLAGVLILMRPGAASLSLTTLLLVYCLVHGILSIAAAVEYRDLFPGAWGWGVLEGLLHVGIAGLIWFGWPASSTWAIGTLLGASFISFGAALVTFALAARRVMQM